MKIHWKNIDKNNEFEEHLMKRLQKIDRFDGISIDTIRITCEYLKNKNEFSVTFNVPVKNGKTIIATTADINLIAASNNAIEKAIDQMRRVKTKKEK